MTFSKWTNVLKNRLTQEKQIENKEESIQRWPDTKVHLST